MNQHTLFITGGAGYVGAMLCNDFASRPDVKTIIALDKEVRPDLLNAPMCAHPEKIIWIDANTADDSWQDTVKAHNPDIIIHTAWQIREMYGNQKTQWQWNIDGSDKVFDLAFSLPSVKKLIHFSTVSSYGAFPSNTLEHRFLESEPFRKTDYLYAEEKRIAEEHLKEKYEAAAPTMVAPAAVKRPQVFIVRPAAITGPRGRYMRIRFGLQAALSGQLKENFIHRLISTMVSFVPVTKKWARQFIHEDEIEAIVEKLAFSDIKGEYEIFNACPPGAIVTGKDMAHAVGKKAIPIHPYLIRSAFFVMWHISRGRVPTSRGGWKSYSYPIIVDGSKVTKDLGYTYIYPSKEAFVKKEGKYMKYIKA